MAPRNRRYPGRIDGDHRSVVGQCRVVEEGPERTPSPRRSDESKLSIVGKERVQDVSYVPIRGKRVYGQDVRRIEVAV
jgi:hypothetical protein